MLLIKNKRILTGMVLNVVFNAGFWLWLVLLFKNMNDLIPLHYTIYFGIDLIGEKIKIFTLPLLGVFILIVNNFLSLLLYHKERVVSYFLTYSALVCNLFLILAGYFILNS